MISNTWSGNKKDLIENERFNTTNQLSKNPGLNLVQSERIRSDDGYYFPPDENFDNLMTFWKSSVTKLKSIELECIKSLKVDRSDSLVYTGMLCLQINTIIGPYTGKLVTLRKIENLDYALLVAFDGQEWYWVDATTYGNIIAYATHSEDPNCKIEKVTHKGMVYLALQTIKTVRPNEKLTFNKKHNQYCKVPLGVLDHVLEEISNLRYCYVPTIYVAGTNAREMDVVAAFPKQRSVTNEEPSRFIIRCIARDRLNDNQPMILGQLIQQDFKGSSNWYQTSIFQKLNDSDIVGFYAHNSKQVQIRGYINENGVISTDIEDQYRPEPHVEKLLRTKNTDKKESPKKTDQKNIPKCPYKPNETGRYCPLEYIYASGSVIKVDNWLVAFSSRQQQIPTGRHLFRVVCIAMDQDTNQEVIYAQWYRTPLRNPDLLFATPVFHKLKVTDIIRKQYLPDVLLDNMNNSDEIVEGNTEEFDPKAQVKKFLDTPKKAQSSTNNGNITLTPIPSKRVTIKRKRDESDIAYDSRFFEELLMSGSDVEGWYSISEEDTDNHEPSTAPPAKVSPKRASMRLTKQTSVHADSDNNVSEEEPTLLDLGQSKPSPIPNGVTPEHTKVAEPPQTLEQAVQQLTNTMDVIQNVNWNANKGEGYKMLGLLTLAKSMLKKQLANKS